MTDFTPSKFLFKNIVRDVTSSINKDVKSSSVSSVGILLQIIKYFNVTCKNIFCLLFKVNNKHNNCISISI